MSISKKNGEGYYDPTAYDALTSVMKSEKAKKKVDYKPLVYVCSPYSGDVDQNVKNARQFCRFALERNCIPLAPHLLFPQFMDDDNPAEREMAMFMNYVLLGKCDELWVFGSQVSKGMELEIAVATKRNQKIRWFGRKAKGGQRNA